MVDDVEIDYYDSNTEKKVPKQDWIAKNTDQQYWERGTEVRKVHQQVFKANIDTAKQRFNQTGGVHIYQTMYGCEWDDETGEVNGYRHYGYDGEDFLSFDLRTETWVAPKEQAVITKNKWDHNWALTAQEKNYLKQECPEWLKKYVNYGRSSLMRTDVFQLAKAIQDSIAVSRIPVPVPIVFSGDPITYIEWKASFISLVGHKVFSSSRGNLKCHGVTESMEISFVISSPLIEAQDVPSVSLLQKSSSSLVTCHATDFYPNRAEMVWKKDGVEFHEGVNKGEILTNNDGTFQMSVDLDVSSVKPEDWHRYRCVFQLSGVNEGIVTKLDKAVIKTNKGKSDEGNSFSLIIPVVVAVVVLAAIAVIAFIIYKKRTERPPPSPVENCEVQEQMLPRA
ncbi:class I histocompatibility antigen, F10 alpha chain-like [Oreochromis aureus]|uniref:class I histocompatibility antigen, F10 alpha chain-like n=1 Tax=Oreochromis aureus TaxID=47969 RepID=UPI0019537AEA|nr:class I histocompatibility antigen, F10 alpha chain-like [Oreochromis aureus]